MTTTSFPTIAIADLDHVTGGDALGNELTAALRIGLHQPHASAAPSTAGIHYDRSLGACTDGFGIVNCPRRR